MQKIPTLFERDATTSHIHPVIDKVRDGCEWVLQGEGIAVEKIDGENCKIRLGTLYKRFKPKDGEPDDTSYLQCVETITADHKFIDALKRLPPDDRRDGVYEAVGPRFKGNPYGLMADIIVPILPAQPNLIIHEKDLGLIRTFAGIRAFLEKWPIEGIVFRRSYHTHILMAKIKREDYGLVWPDPRRIKWSLPLPPTVESQGQLL